MEEITVKVEAIGIENGETQLLLENEETVIVESEMLALALANKGYNGDIELAAISGKLCLKLKRTDSVSEIEVLDF